MAVILYPISGFLADVYCGRYRVVMISMCFFIVSLTVLSGVTLLQLVSSGFFFPTNWSLVMVILLVVLVVLFGLTVEIGMIGYHTNFVQFGLDQLMEAPSRYLSLFIHWIILADSLSCVAVVLISLHRNPHSSQGQALL